MSAWKWNRSYDEDENLDWLIIREGPIVKYFSSDILEDDLKELEKLRYQIVDLSTSGWRRENIHKRIKESLDFPDYYGGNRNAFEDCLDDKFDKKYKGLVIVFRHFDLVYSQNKDFMNSLMDGIARVAWAWLLTGQRLIAIVQSNDPYLEMDKIGGYLPPWNGAEWFDDKRKKN